LNILKLDREIPQSIWNNYLKKYKDKYLLSCDEIGIWSIRLKKKLGFIQPYSIINKQLVAVLTFNSSKHKSFFKNRLMRNKENDVEITQEGIYELCVVFNEKNIEQYENLLFLFKKPEISQKRRKELSEHMKKIRYNRGTNGN